MNILLKMISALGLGLTVVPAFLVFAGVLAWSTHAALMLVGTALWFISAPFWMDGARRSSSRRRQPAKDTESG